MEYVYASAVVVFVFLVGRWYEYRRVKGVASETVRGLVLAYLDRVREKIPTDGQPVEISVVRECFTEVEDELKSTPFSVKIVPEDALNP